MRGLWRNILEQGKLIKVRFALSYFDLLCMLMRYVDRKRALELAAPAPIKKHPLDPISGPGKPTKTPRTGGVIPDEYLPPNNVLFVREVPEEYDLDALTALFQRYTGFREVRIVPLPSFKGTAFVEYEANEGAIQAREALNGRELGSGGKALKVTYQKAG